MWGSTGKGELQILFIPLVLKLSVHHITLVDLLKPSWLSPTPSLGQEVRMRPRICISNKFSDNADQENTVQEPLLHSNPPLSISAISS